MNPDPLERHAETLALLAETRDFMSRWPSNALNRAMLARIDAHLSSPEQRFPAEHVTVLEGGTYDAVGRCYLEARLHGDVLTVQLPERWAMPDHEVCDKLKQGLSFILQRSVS